MVRALVAVSVVWLLWVGLAHLLAERVRQHPLLVRAAAVPPDPPCISRRPLLNGPNHNYDYRQRRAFNDKGVA